MSWFNVVQEQRYSVYAGWRGIVLESIRLADGRAAGSGRVGVDLGWIRAGGSGRVVGWSGGRSR